MKPAALEQSWSTDAKARELGERQVDDIAVGDRDRKLREALAVFAVAGAAKRWDELRAMSEEQRRNALHRPHAKRR